MSSALRSLRSATSLIGPGEWNEPANYGSGFDSCLADNGLPPGLYPPPGSSSSTTSFAGWSTFAQGQATTPTAHPAPKSSSCTTYSKLVRSASPALVDRADLHDVRDGQAQAELVFQARLVHQEAVLDAEALHNEEDDGAPLVADRVLTRQAKPTSTVRRPSCESC